MKENYYQIRLRQTIFASVGVIKMTDNKIPVDKIEEAISAHMVEEVKVVEIRRLNFPSFFEIDVKTENGIQTFDAELTWLYI